MKWKLSFLLVLFSLRLETNAVQAIAQRLPKWEQTILDQVAKEYNLQGDAYKLLYVIRIVENGGPGREMGVMRSAAQRFADDSEKSLRLQAQWAAGTIKKRYKGDLKAFAKRWCPVNADNWYRMADCWMKK